MCIHFIRALPYRPKVGVIQIHIYWEIVVKPKFGTSLKNKTLIRIVSYIFNDILSFCRQRWIYRYVFECRQRNTVDKEISIHYFLFIVLFVGYRYTAVT